MGEEQAQQVTLEPGVATETVQVSERATPVDTTTTTTGSTLTQSQLPNLPVQGDVADITDCHRLEGTAFGNPSRDPTGVHRSLLRDDLDSESRNVHGTRNWAVKFNSVVTATALFSASFAWNHTYCIETPTRNLFAVRDQCHAHEELRRVRGGRTPTWV